MQLNQSGQADTISNQITLRQAPAQQLRPTSWMLQQRLSSLSHRASHTRVSGIIRNFHFELPGTVQYTFNRYFSTRKSAILNRSQPAPESVRALPQPASRSRRWV